MRTSVALVYLVFAAGVATELCGCIDDSPPPTIATGAVWIAPLPQQVEIDWQGPQSCSQVLDCDAPSIPFTIESLRCDNCTTGSAGIGDGTVYTGDAVLTGIASGIGPITITAVVRDTSGNSATVQTTTVGDVVTGITAACSDNFVDGTTSTADTCTTARTSSTNSLLITPTFQTSAHGSFQLGAYSNVADQVAPTGAGAADLSPSAFPTVSPAFVGWEANGSVYSAELDPSTSATSVALQWTIGTAQLSTTVALPPLAP